MVQKWFCLSWGGLGLVDARCIQILVSRQFFFPISLPYHLSTAAVFTRRFCLRAWRFNWAGKFLYCKFYFYCPFVSHLIGILRGHQLVPLQAHYDRRVPFHSQNNQSLCHTCPKASWVLVLSGCGKSLLHGSVGRQMRDCTPG